MKLENDAPPKLAPSLAPHELEPEETFDPASPERRARLQRYVKITVAGCVALCLAAAVRVGVTHAMASEDAAPAYVAAARGPEAPTTPPAPEATAAVTAAVVASSQTAAPASPKTASQEREVARRSLEQGKLRDAVSAAERATTIDPTDAETWLILGAANQELGHGAAAHAAYRACLKSAKRGPVRECRSMLH
jgi:hypothetical protein